MIRLKNISIGYREPLAEHLDATFPRGELAALVGRNGTGKSTLLRAIAGLQRPLGGEVWLDGRPLPTLGLHERARLLSFVSTERVDADRLRVEELVAFGRAPYTSWLGALTADDRRHIDHVLDLVGMGSFARKPLDTLSDGERQRATIARALAQQTPIILLDEPTAFLDLANKYEICLLLRELAHDQGKTILFSTHDLNIALEFCDTLALIEGRTLRRHPPEALYFDTDTLSIRTR